MCRGRQAALILALFLAVEARATSIVVRPDGSGDVRTLNEALARSTDGDVVLVGPGVYRESIDPKHSLVIRSLEGPESTILDGEGERAIVTAFAPGSLVRFEGLTFAHGFTTDTGGAINVRKGARVIAVDCVIRDSEAALHVRTEEGLLRLEHCVVGPHTNVVHDFGAATVIQGARMEVFDSVFVGNRSSGSNGGIGVNRATLVVERSLFVGNAAAHGPAVLWWYGGDGRVVDSTFHCNDSGTATVYSSTPNVLITNNIFAGETRGRVFDVPAETFVQCNLVWDAAAMDAVAADSLRNVHAPPAFCDPTSGDLSAAAGSPPHVASATCGTMGAWFAACGVEADDRVRRLRSALAAAGVCPPPAAEH